MRNKWAVIFIPRALLPYFFMKCRPFNPALISIFYDVKLRTFFFPHFLFLRITCTRISARMDGSAALGIKNKNSTLSPFSLSHTRVAIS